MRGSETLTGERDAKARSEARRPFDNKQKNFRSVLSGAGTRQYAALDMRGNT